MKGFTVLILELSLATGGCILAAKPLVEKIKESQTSAEAQKQDESKAKSQSR